MQNKIISIAILLVLCFGCFYFVSFNSGKYPKRTNSSIIQPRGFINDFENILTDSEENSLLTITKLHESNTTNQIAIVTLDSLYKYPNFELYTLAIANNWGVGTAKKDNGVLIAVSKKMRKIRIQVGDGLRYSLTDKECQYIIDSTIIPRIKTGKYYEGIRAGLNAVIDELD